MAERTPSLSAERNNRTNQPVPARSLPILRCYGQYKELGAILAFSDRIVVQMVESQKPEAQLYLGYIQLAGAGYIPAPATQDKSQPFLQIA